MLIPANESGFITVRACPCDPNLIRGQRHNYAKMIDDPEGYITSSGSNTAVLWGSWLEVITAFACVGTAVALASSSASTRSSSAA